MISVILNPVSGGASPSTARARARFASELLAAHGADGRVCITEHRRHATALAVDAVRRGDRLVISWGGDGTMNEVASALVGTATAMGLMPSGSGNGLARELGIPRDPAAALTHALRAKPRPIDAGSLDGRWFFSVAGIGFDAHIAAAFDRDPRRRRGFSSYLRITARELLRYRPRRYRVDGHAPRTALLITIANSAQFGNGIRIAPGARVDDGELDLVTVEERSRIMTVLNLPRLLSGTIAQVRGVSIARVAGVVIESDELIEYHVDGEPHAGGTRLEAQVRPGALLVAA